jgi:hypothetical protein
MTIDAKLEELIKSHPLNSHAQEILPTCMLEHKVEDGMEFFLPCIHGVILKRSMT